MKDKAGTLTINYVNGSKDTLPHTSKQDFERMLGAIESHTKNFVFDYNDAKVVVVLENVLNFRLVYDKKESE